MWTESHQESPLYSLEPLRSAVEAADAQRLRIVERPFLDLAVLRGNARSPAFMQTIERALGAPPPVAPNTVAYGNRYLLAWMGPDEWWLQSLTPARPTLEPTLRPSLLGQSASVVDVSSGYTVLELRGEQVRDVLEKGCPLDVHPRVFGPGQCAQSHYFKASVMVRAVDDGGVEIVVRRSFADYVGRIVLDAAREYLT